MIPIVHAIGKKIPCLSPLHWDWPANQYPLRKRTRHGRVSVAGIRTFVAGSKGKTIHVGVDVHKRSYSVALLRADGAWKEWTATSSPKALESALLPLRFRIGAVV
jgi:hypothetical protein